MYIESGQCKNGAEINCNVLFPNEMVSLSPTTIYSKSLLTISFKNSIACIEPITLALGDNSSNFSTDPA